ncbi:MAG: hypothetical protein ABIO19_01805 [Burkholderiaceae bacterium]
MATINLTYTVITNPDSLVGFNFYVASGQVFDAGEYAEAYNLNRTDLDSGDVNIIQNAAATLNAGEWLMVSHSIAA